MHSRKPGSTEYELVTFVQFGSLRRSDSRLDNSYICMIYFVFREKAEMPSTSASSKDQFHGTQNETDKK